MLRTLVCAGLLLVGCTGVVGCIAPASAAQRLSDAAIDMNTAMRFGRTDIAVEYVAASARDTFAMTHAEWGKRVRIVDVEFSSVRVKEKDEADVTVNYTWVAAEDATMRETRLIQHWKDNRGTWTIQTERTEGDPGLLGKSAGVTVVQPPAKATLAAGQAGPPALPVEVVGPAARPAARPGAMRFQTRVIYDE